MMRGLTRRWIFDAPVDERLPLVERVLAARQLTGADAIERFCEPKLTHLHDPGLLPQIDEAAQRVIDAVRRDEHIVIYGDYDVDGITATAILFHVIRAAAPAARVLSYVPHRLEEGYGLNAEALRQLRAEGADLVISVDCGVTAVEPAAVAREIGLDLIITDHHRPPAVGEPLPEAVAIVHPGLPGSDYPFPELCGAGVAFKLAWRFATAWCGSQRVASGMQETLLDMLPLAALGTIADVAPLVGENRVLTRFGLDMIARTPLVGLRALIGTAGLAGESIDTRKVGFVLAPRLNACGRMGHAAEAVRLLTEAGADEARDIAERLAELNRQRQKVERSIFEEAAARAEAAGMTTDERRIIVLADEQWHPGVVGIVCSRLADRFGRPAILLQRQDDQCAGSARSIEGYSIHDGLSACASHLMSFGGHEHAAGLRLEASRLEAFTEAITAHANARIEVDQLVAPISIDCDARLDELDRGSVSQLAGLAPFGRANRRPVVRICGLALAEPPRRIGSHARHLALQLSTSESHGRGRLRAVWWNAGELAERLAVGMPIDVAIEPKLNTFNGLTSVEGEIRDVMVV
ncbi:MAG: single-stranded-DNA-specific exonuclease RecJ [Planctomycetota bacterium]|jgi:single-stranded-DNA-specific exonuclease